MKTDEEKPENKKPVTPMSKFMEENHEYWRNKQKNGIPSNLRTYEDLMDEVEETIKTSVCDQAMVAKLKARGYNISQKWAIGEVGYFDLLKGNLYQVQITEGEEWGEHTLAWWIEIELQKVYEH